MSGVKNNPLTIFVCTHVPFRVPPYIEARPDIYTIITNSRERFLPTKLRVLRVDNMQCDYGPEENLCLNEWRMINAIYHMKNLPEYIGICHYNRYFDPSVIERLDMKVLTDSGYDMVIGQPARYSDLLKEEYDTFTYYGYWHNYKDFLTYEKVIREQYPEMLEAFLEMKEQDYLYNSALMILKRDDFLNLCDYSFKTYESMKKEFGIHNDKEALQYVLDRKDEYVKPYNAYYTAEMQSRLLSYGQERYGTNTWLRKKREDGTKILDKAAEIQWYMLSKKDIGLQ